MMKKNLLITALLLAFSLSAVACGGNETVDPADTTPDSVTESAAESADTSITDTAAESEDETAPESAAQPDTDTESETTATPESETEGETAGNEAPCDHKFGSWTPADGQFHERTCSRCGDKAQAEHLWDEGTLINGQIFYTCSVCGCETAVEPPESETIPPETEAPKPFDPVYMANADALVPNFSIDSTQHITSADKVENHVHIVPTIGDPYYVPFGQVNGGRYVAIKYRTDNAEGMALQFYIASTGTHPTDDTTMMRQPITGDGEWHVALFDTKSLMDAGLYDGSYISYFRFDPMDCEYKVDENGEHYKDENDLWVRHEMPEGAYIDIEYIAFFETEEDFKLFENRPTHFISADYLFENASVEDNLAYNQFMYASMGEGYITLTGTDTDAYVTAIVPGTTDAVTTKYLFIKYRTAHKDLLGQVFTGSGEIWEGDQNKLNFPYEGDGEWHLLMVDLTPNETLTGNAGFLRFDFFQYGADPDTKEEHTIDVQYLAFFETAEEAAAFDAAYEAAAAQA